MNDTAIQQQEETPKYLKAIYGAEKHFCELVQNTGLGLAFKEEALHARIACEANEYLMKIAQDNPSSLQKAIYSLATVGLSLNKATAYAYLVPRKKEICLDISYRGLVKIATDTGSVRWAKAEIVHEKDEFIMQSVGEKPIHNFNPFGDRGEVVGVYSVAKTSDGDFLTDAMSEEEVNKIKAKSDNASSIYSAWSTFPNEMRKKAVIKRASKLWPKTERSERLEQAIEIVNEHQGIDFEKQHTPEQFQYYLQTIKDDGMPLEHFVFMRSLELETRASLGSALKKTIERGGKQKEMERINEIYNKGESQLFDYVEILAESEDEFQINETIEELPDGALELIISKLPPEAATRINQLNEATQ